MLNPYTSLSVAELLDQRTSTLAELKRIRDGVQMNSTGIGGKSFGFNRERLAQLREDLQLTVAALQLKDPATYGKLITETYSDFSVVEPVG
jgi:hypothetical protein